MLLPYVTFDEAEERAKKFAAPGRYTQKDRENIPAEDFAGPNKTFPIVVPQDVSDAARLVGHAKDPAAVKANIIKIAKRKGAKFVAKLPDSWREDKEERAMSAPTPTLERAAQTAKVANFYFPIRARNEETWEIEGVMSNEDVDTYQTGFDYESMKAAVERWSGNIREQHDKHKAVGRRIYATFDDAKKEVVLRAMISKGAPDTWEKIKDGTLTGFSIGAYAPKQVEYRTVAGKRVPYFKDFDLAEVSVVDVPSNPGAAKGLTIFRAANFSPSGEDEYGAEFLDYPEETVPADSAGDTPAAMAAAAESLAVDAQAAPQITPAENAAPALERAAAAGSMVDQRVTELLKPRNVNGAAPGEDPRAADLRRAQMAQAVSRQREMGVAAMAGIGQVPGVPGTVRADVPGVSAGPATAALPSFTSVSLSPIDEATEVLPPGMTASPDQQGVLMRAAGMPEEGEEVMSQTVSRAMSMDESDTLDKQMEKDRGPVHQHDHEHLNGYSPLHMHSHEHQHADGTVHAHPHMHNHDHHDHYSQEGHSHPHSHSHEHSHEYRMAAPDLSRVTCPYPGIPQAAAPASVPASSRQSPVAAPAAVAPTSIPSAVSASSVPSVSAPSQERAAAPHGPFKGDHAHEHHDQAGGSHNHKHSHQDDADHSNHDHPEEDESGESEGDQNTSRAVVPELTTVAQGMQERVGARVSASMRESLHNIRDTAMKECNCPECQDLMEACTEEGDEVEGEEGEEGTRAVTHSRRLQRLQVAKLTRSIEASVQAPLQALIAQLRAVVARYTGIQQPDLTRVQAQLDQQHSVLTEVQGLVNQIAQAEQRYGPVTRAADPSLRPVEKVLGLSPASVLDASAPGGATGTVTPEQLAQEVLLLRSQIASGQLNRQEDQIAAATRLVRRANGF
jgi:phage head maturation protease